MTGGLQKKIKRQACAALNKIYFGTVKYLTIVIPLNFKALKSCNAK